jgi:neutral trehalase
MAAIDNRDLAYANAIEITREITESGFVPNFATVCDLTSYDRSQPPVGAMIVLGLYRTFGDRWLLELLFDDLLRWNRWWDSARREGELLCWGSDPYVPRVGAHFETAEVDNAIGPMMESGLDNSPMWDGVPFDQAKHLQCLHDAGLNGLYVRDCESLEVLAGILGRSAEAGELHARGDRYRHAIRERLWDEKTGLFLNRRTDTGERSPRVSPTNFYPLLGGAGTDAQAARMIKEHLLHPARFGGEFLLPSISRDDPAYLDQNYWRGRIWAPMNFLVYAGLCRYDLPEARSELAAKSHSLLLKEWREHGRVCENYCANTGQGGEVRNSDAFYHWGGLLGLITFIERAFLPDFLSLRRDKGTR